MIYSSKSVEDTQKIAVDLTREIYNLNTEQAVVVALEGELGAGKTVFVKALAQELGIADKVKSPTFVLMKKYTLAKSLKLKAINLYHLDCYRAGDHTDLKIPELKEILDMSHNLSFTTSRSRKRPQRYATHQKASHNVVIIEWAERVKKILSY